MGKYNWKDNYGSQFDENVHKVLWASVLGNKDVTITNSTRGNPTCSLGNNYMYNPNGNNLVRIVISSGTHTGNYNSSNGKSYICGQGMGNTIWKKSLSVTYPNNIYFYDMTLDYTGNATLACNASGCEVKSVAENIYNSFYKCKLRVALSLGSTVSNISIVGITIAANRYSANDILYDNCNIAITSQTDVNLSTTRYAAFNNCKFKIGSESGYTALSGTTPDELRASFVSRCEAQRYVVNPVTEFDYTAVKGGRWIFSNNSCIDGLVLKGSEIHQYEIPRLRAFGYKTERNDRINITTDKTKAGSFYQDIADSKLNITNNSIQFKPSVDISTKIDTYAQSNIIWLGGKYQLNLIDIIHNFPKEYGVFLDSTPTLSNTPTTAIEEGKTYYVRSSNANEATVTYNGVAYSSALVYSNNVFIGVANKTTFVGSANALVYEVFDNKALHQTIQMRIVNKIPSGNISAGTALADATWYLVEHDTDQSNRTDYVTYGGSKYYAGSSFLASGTGTFAKYGNIHVRRCWKDAFNYSTETTDKSFWSSEQKPQWFDVLPNDLRCLMKYNNGLQAEMQADNATYIASGHPDFYNSILGMSGTSRPAYPIKGTYMQLRLKINTQNPM
ncbi:hypothetical protein D0T84_15970 [Dysgonomonas sp. 521]|uniref:hypothetical protein n=1 Tax=Dysgonomonas sp. 521 TaxID=2302932 RepID=UPI0013D68D47|nr:hypothetical protein [Dysgonomonas sp. 521]NDV96400.1 hypothetical protein [Dysgonomonas sp. 521]